MHFNIQCSGNVKKKALWAAMPDSGAQVSMAPYDLVEQLGISFRNDCEDTTILIGGVGGTAAKKQEETRVLKVWIENPKNGRWTAELVYISKAFTMSLISYSCLLRLQLLTESSFTDPDGPTNLTATATKPLEKLSLCRSSQILDNANRTITCGCPKWKYGLSAKDMKADLLKQDRALSKLLQNDEVRCLKIDEQRVHYENFLQKQFAETAFNQCETQNLHTMTVKKMKVNLKPGARPYQNSKPYPVPLNLKDETKHDIDMAIKMGILEAVLIGEVTKWCAPMLAIAKKLGGI
jgi:hypothetical protein